MRVPLPMISPTKNQQITSVVTSVLSQPSLTVRFLQFGFLIILTASLIAMGISIGVGGLSSETAHRRTVFVDGARTILPTVDRRLVAAFIF